MRNSEIKRKTAETDISLSLCLDGRGEGTINSGVGFLDHMLTLFSRHGGFDLNLLCNGDISVDAHHTTEDIGIVLGQAFAECLGDKRGIARYGDIILPMDEALILCAVDISGRPCLVCDTDIPTEKVGEFDCELVNEFFLAFTRTAGVTMHIKQLCGSNSHHIIEGIFKAAGRTLAKAVSVNADDNRIPSTKGVL